MGGVNTVEMSSANWCLLAGASAPAGASNHIVRPIVAATTSQHREEVMEMPRPAAISLALLQRVEQVSDQMAVAMSDGVMDRSEQMQIARGIAGIGFRAERVHANLTFIDRALHGDGIDGRWFRQMARQEVRDRQYMQPVDDDDPEPDGPAGMARAA
jgi:nicotinamide mononucleotide (NMN) deamidase PncC